MAKIIDLPTFSDERGDLTVIEKILPFSIKRMYYIYNAIGKRGGHRHLKTAQALICVSGSCSVFCQTKTEDHTFSLNAPNACLLLEPADWHTMQDFSPDCVLLVLASEYFDKDDYIDEEYSRD